MFLASKYQAHSPDVLNDNKEAMPDYIGNDIIINHTSSNRIASTKPR